MSSVSANDMREGDLLEYENGLWRVMQRCAGLPPAAFAWTRGIADHVSLVFDGWGSSSQLGDSHICPLTDTLYDHRAMHPGKRAARRRGARTCRRSCGT